jgi:hypothetical protein
MSSVAGETHKGRGLILVTSCTASTAIAITVLWFAGQGLADLYQHLT